MAVTITTVPSPAIKSAYRPIPWEVETTRFDDIGNDFTVNAVANSGGFCRFTTAAPHGFVVGDLVLVEGAAETRYNGLQRVTFIPSGSLIDTTKPFFASEGSSPTKTVTLKNNNFQIRADIYVYNGDNLTISGILDAAGDIRVVTATDHNLSVGNRVEIRGTASYNSIHVVSNINSSTSFDIVFVFVSTEAAGTVIKSTIRGVKRQKAVIVGTDNLFQFDPVGILEAQLSYDIETLGISGVTTPNDGSIEDYFIDFTEEHDDEDGLLQEYANTEGDTKHVLNITHQHQETQNTTAYLMDGDTKLWLTNAPRTMKKAFAEEFQLSFITDAINITVRFERFDNNGASIGVSTIAAEVIRQRGIFSVNSNVFTLAHTKIIIWVYDEDAAKQISEKITFIRDDLCYRDPVRLHWLNRLGGFDAYTFTGERRETVKAKKTTYSKDLGASFAIKDRGTTTLGVAANENVQVWSEFIPEATQRWLAELATSPEVYMEVGGELVPVDSNSVNMPFVRHSKPQQIKVRFNMPDLIIQQG